jgi:protein involved in sex pheromone biosynthesis
VAKCAYRRERIREIEEKWIDENIEDEEERRRKKEILSIILKRLGEKADCRFEAIPSARALYWFPPAEHKAPEGR